MKVNLIANTKGAGREIALECKRIFKEEYPDIAEALGW